MRLNNVSQRTAACPMSVVGILKTYVAAMFAIILAGAPAHAQRESFYVEEAVEGAAGWTFQKYYFEFDEFTDSAETGYVKITLSKTGGLQMLLRTYCDRPHYCKSEFAVIHWEAEAVSPGYSDMRVRVDRKPFEIYRVRNSGVTNFRGDYYQQVSIDQSDGSETQTLDELVAYFEGGKTVIFGIPGWPETVRFDLTDFDAVYRKYVSLVAELHDVVGWPWHGESR